MMAIRNAPKYNPQAKYEVQTSDVEYRRDGDESWLARIYQPQGTGPFPALIEVHGGAWNMGTRTSDELMNQALAASGLVVAAIDFRLAPQHSYPAQAVDLNYAIRWLKAHAPEFNAEPNFVGGMGASSGGYSVILAAMRPHDPRYAALELPKASDVDASLAYVVALWPVIDPYARYLYVKEAGRQDTVTRTEAYFPSEEVMQEGNPQFILDRGEKIEMLPILVLAPDPDEAVPKPIFERFVAAYRAAGGAVQIEWFPGARHGFGAERSADTERALALIKDFVARQLEIAAAPA
jgi:acetyl esterase/lipase